MNNEQGNTSSDPKHISESIVDALHNMGPAVAGDEEGIRQAAVDAVRRQKLTEKNDLESEAGGVDAQRRDLMDYAEETGDPKVDESIQELKARDLEIDVERRNLPPEE